MRENGRFLLCIVILGLIITCSIWGTVMSCSANEGDISEKEYRQMEQEYVQRVRVLLAGRGYANSGVMLTHMTQADSSRIYTVTIYHERILSLPKAKQKEIEKAVLALAFEAPGCGFCQEFLTL